MRVLRNLSQSPRLLLNILLGHSLGHVLPFVQLVYYLGRKKQVALLGQKAMSLKLLFFHDRGSHRSDSQTLTLQIAVGLLVRYLSTLGSRSGLRLYPIHLSGRADASECQPVQEAPLLRQILSG